MVDIYFFTWYYVDSTKNRRNGGDIMNKLRGYIFTKFKSISEFARCRNLDVVRTRRILNGEQELSKDDIIRISNALEDLTRNDFFELFF